MQTTARGETESGPFTPPRPERFAEHLQRCELKAPSPLVIWAPLLAMVFLVIIAGAMGNLIGILLPWLALGGLVLFHVVRMRYLRELERRGQRVQELIVLRRYPETLREGWRLLPQVRSLPVLHTGAIAAMTQALGELGEHESAMVGYGALIDELPEDHPSLPAVRLSRAMAAKLPPCDARR